VRQSKENYIWLAKLLAALCEEYTHRYGKTHKVVRDGLCYALLNIVPNNIPDKPFTEPTPAMPDDVKIVGNSLASYRNYYIKNKTHLAKWKNRPIPEWYHDNTERTYQSEAS
jgi:ribosomal protein L39E